MHRRFALLLALVFVTLGCVLLGPRALNALDRQPSGDLDPRFDAERAASNPSEPTIADLELIETASKRMTPYEGGRLDAPGAVGTLKVPPGALRTEEVLSATTYAVHHEADPAGFAVELMPDGLAFAQKVRFEMPLPPGLEAGDVEIVAWDPLSESWVPEGEQAASADGERLVARLEHFSLRRLRIRPGMSFPLDAERGRGTFYLASDAGNTFERYVEGRWEAVRHETPAYRELMRLGRLGRHDLILSGRLRAITAARPQAEVFRDERRTVAMPSGAPQAQTGWVRIRRLDERGEETGYEVIAKVNDYGPGPAPRRAGVIVDMSRATLEALGLAFGREFGLGAENPDLAWIRVPRAEGGAPMRYLPVQVRAFEPDPALADGGRLR